MMVRPRCSLSALIALVFVTGGGSQAQAQQLSAPAARDAPPVALPGTEQFDLVSAVNGEPYRLFVSLPEGYESEGEARYPVLYLLDAHLTFPAAVSALASMAIQNEVEPLIVVGISHGEPTFESWFVNRWRDFTPSLAPATDSASAAAFGLPPETVRSGGAPGFLRILREEVLPLVEGRYRTSDKRGIAGHSLGGLFAAYALFEAPELFARFGLNSPSLWWGGGEMFEREDAFAAERTRLPAHIFLSAGSEEGSMVPSMQRFAEMLSGRDYEGLSVHTVVFEGESHGSVVPAMMSRTLRVLYAR